jgi:hypothetical protein
LGGDNIVSDALSRDFHLSSHNLSLLIISSVLLEQVPFGLEIQNLPNKISSWLTCLLQNLPSKMQWSKEPMRSKIALRQDTNFYLQSIGCHQDICQNQSMPPWIVWHRPFSWRTSQTQDWTEKASLSSFYNANLEATPTQTNLQNPKQLQQDQYFENSMNYEKLPHRTRLLFVNYLLEPSFLQCNLVNTSKAQATKNLRF